MPRRPALSSTARKRYTEGTHRTLAPQLTLKRVMPLLPALGITRIANVTGLDTIGIPVVVVARPNARSLSVAQGKGSTLAAAQASGVMESIEFWHAERIDRPLRLASARDLALNRPLANLDRLPRLSVSNFSPRLPILWIEGRQLHDDSPRWVPFELVHTDYRLPLPAGSGCFGMTSNGLASGNHWLEAVIHGLCEVIERDATALWAAGGERARRATRLDPATVTDAGCRALLDRFAAAGVLVAIWHTTTDIGVPAFVCEIVEDDAHALRGLGPSAGMGCHLMPGIALSRALTEAAQGRLTRIASSRDDLSRDDYPVLASPDLLQQFRAEFRRAPTPIDFRSVRGFEATDCDADLAFLLHALVQAGLDEAIAVDLTHPALGIPVARVIVPGLEAAHEAPGYVPGPRAQAAHQAWQAATQPA